MTQDCWKSIAEQCFRKYERWVDLIAIEKDKKSKKYVDYDFEGEVRAEWEQLLESVGMFPVDEALYLVVESKEAMVDYYNELVKRLGVGLLLNIIGLPSEVCREVDSYKNCEMYETMVYMKAEYEKIGVYDMFVD
ncbi:hypothetical protein ES708_26934 [subsurface metagenome]